jgi:hypothetical protein
MRLRHNASGGQLQRLVRRLLRSNKSKSDTPVIISGVHAGNESAISIGRVLARTGGRVSVLVDTALECSSPITVFLSEHVYLAEVVNCVPKGAKYTVELLLIEHMDK